MDPLVDGLEADRARAEGFVEQSLAMGTALAPEIGYDKAASIAKSAHRNGTTLREEALKSGHVSADTFDRLMRPETMTRPR